MPCLPLDSESTVVVRFVPKGSEDPPLDVGEREGCGPEVGA